MNYMTLWVGELAIVYIANQSNYSNTRDKRYSYEDKESYHVNSPICCFKGRSKIISLHSSSSVQDSKLPKTPHFPSRRSRTIARFKGFTLQSR